MNTKTSYEDVKKIIEDLGTNNYEDFTKAIISFEKGIDDENILDAVYAEFMDNDINGLLNEDFDYMIDELKEQEISLEEEQIDNDLLNINGNLASDIEFKNLETKDGEKFKVANFSVAINDKAGNVKYTKCAAYNEKISQVEKFKKGDFVHIFGKEKITKSNDGKEYSSLSVLSANILKAKVKENSKDKRTFKSTNSFNKKKQKSSTLNKLNKYKEKASKMTRNSPKKENKIER